MSKHRTIDREASAVLTTEKIGNKRYRTPEGYLFVEDVPAARTGEMVYAAGEIPLESLDGLIRVERDEKALFAESTLASYNGKPVIDDHPDKDNITAENWRRLSGQMVGITLNPRRGEGSDSDVMLVDLLIMDVAAIRDIEAGKVEVSAGYEADYEQTGPGRGRQENIIGNHIALVEKGRCGPRCAIGDHQPQELSSMANTKQAKRRAVMQDAARKIFKDAEEAFMQAVGDPSSDPTEGDEGDEDGATHIHIHAGGQGGGGAAASADPAEGVETKDDPMESRMAALESAVQQILAKLGAPAGDGGDPNETPADDDVSEYKDAIPEELAAAQAAKTGDSMALQTSFTAVLADAEVLVPGFRLPTFDAKKGRRATLDSMCALRRDVMRTLATTTDGDMLIKTVSGGLDIDKSPCTAVATAFRAAAGARRLVNNASATNGAGRMASTLDSAATMPMTLAQLNVMHRKHYGQSAH